CERATAIERTIYGERAKGAERGATWMRAGVWLANLWEVKLGICWERTMSEPSAAITLLREILDAWKNRNERSVVKHAGTLMFWDEGLQKGLRKIANGEADKKPFAQLRGKLEEREPNVRRAMKEMMHQAMRMGPSKVAEQVNNVVTSTSFGKGEIRSDIYDLLKHKSSVDVRGEARLICNAIEALNAELRKLHRMVYG